MRSHPHQSLAQHLIGVWENIQHVLARHGGSFWSTEELYFLTAITCLFHDMGKATAFFQKYMDKITQGKQVKGGPNERHSPLSSLIGYFLAKEYIQQKQSFSSISAFFVYVAIKEHHGNLLDFVDEKNNINPENLQLMKKQLQTIDYDKLGDELTQITTFLPQEINNLLPLNQEKISLWLETMNEELSLQRKRKRGFLIKKYDTSPFTLEKMDNYFTFCFLYSLLLEGDKSQAGVGKLRQEVKLLADDLIDSYKEKQDWELSVLNLMREEAYQEVAANLDKSDETSLFSLTLPTGLGKTLAAYNFALKLRKKRQQERKGMAPRIIYSLPFLSVIDQNLGIFEEVLKEGQIDFDNSYILKHHHLSPARYMDKNLDEIYAPNASKLLIEGWNSEIIVTTFIQLFESLISHRNDTLRRFHKFSNAIILVDEIQALPVKYWDLIRYMFLYVSRKMNTDIILITATRPEIFLPEDGMLELCCSERYFSQLDRITLRICLEKKTIQEFVDSLSLEKSKSYLFILNTIGSAQKLYKELSEKVKEPIGFLSTQVIMKHRQERIKDIKDAAYRIVVSTQIVEAGVDIDFDVVYRDFAPLDSINQSAGRCNRNKREGIKGEVNIIQLWDGKRPYCELIYDQKVLLKTTETVLKDRKEIPENEFFSLINEYFSILRKRMAQEESLQILSSVENLCFHSYDEKKVPISKFKLIEEDFLRENVFIEVDDKAREIWQACERLLDIQNYFEREREFSLIKNDFYSYVISVPNTYDLPAEVNYFRYVGYSVLDTYYDIQLGYKGKIDAMTW